MLVKKSAGSLAYRHRPDGIEVFLVHPGGPFWARKDQHAWSMPKGEVGDQETPLAAARREFEEEAGHRLDGAAVALKPLRVGGKEIRAFAVASEATENVNPAPYASVPTARPLLYAGRVPIVAEGAVGPTIT